MQSLITIENLYAAYSGNKYVAAWSILALELHNTSFIIPWLQKKKKLMFGKLSSEVKSRRIECLNEMQLHLIRARVMHYNKLIYLKVKKERKIKLLTDLV